MRRVTRLGLLVLCACGLIGAESSGLFNQLGGGISAAHAAPKVTRKRCIKTSNENGKQTLKIGLTNGCTQAIQCRVSWSIICGEDKSITQKSYLKAFALDTGASEDVVASAKQCGDRAWKIRDVRWHCRSVKE